MLLVLRERKKVKKTGDFFQESRDQAEKLSFRYEIYRKLTHLVVLGIILFYFTLGFILQNVFIRLLELYPEDSEDLEIFSYVSSGYLIDRVTHC
jgi:hypothetical protein